MFRRLCLLVALVAPQLAPVPRALWATEPAPAPAASSSLEQQIASSCGDAQVVIVGERHREPNSHDLFLKLVESFVARGERVVVGLEIRRDRQADLDAALAGQRPCRGVAGPPIESESYQGLICSLGGLTRLPGAPVRVLAIDTPPDAREDRDAAMASRMEEALRSEPCDRAVLLVGNLHALKEIPWDRQAPEQRPKLAGILQARGMKVVSLVQQFGERCDRSAEARFDPPHTESASAAVCSVWSCLRTDAAREESTAPLAVDGVISWNCTNGPVQ